MGWTDTQRAERRHRISDDDQRNPFQRDRDRILYSSAFHRLSGVTQIVRAGELDIFHTRQQHTIKVSQIGRRLAEHCIGQSKKSAASLGIHPEVVEAACLAHDLGHPPFGHAAETELDSLVREHGDSDGYEGNAQTFRILTKLSVRYSAEQCAGLDLTRATLAACLKYPWFRDVDNKDSPKFKKWSAYRTERDDFDWVREFLTIDEKSLEAEIMDWADDIAYSVHDLEDFHRVGIVPWHFITDRSLKDKLTNDIIDEWKGAPSDAGSRIRKAIDGLRETLILYPTIAKGTYTGTREQRHHLRNFTSLLIGNFIHALSVKESSTTIKIDINLAGSDAVRVLKHMARKHVIGLPSLHAQQYGQRKIISNLFETLMELYKADKLEVFPMRLRYFLEYSDGSDARKIADCIASLSENEAIQFHERISGQSIGSVLDPIIR